MVEVQHHDVGLAAVHARVSHQVFDQAREIGRLVLKVVTPCVRNVRVTPALVVLAIPRLLTRATVGVAAIACAILEVEVGHGFHFPTPAAALLRARPATITAILPHAF
jgi:hypothetical protein